MKKRKTKARSLRKKAVRLPNRPNSDDSGVSLEMSAVKKKDTQQYDISLENTGATEDQNVDKDVTLETSLEKPIESVAREGDPPEVCSHTEITPLSLPSKPAAIGRNSFSFEDETQSCLDYEPFEDEPEDYEDSSQSRPISPEEMQNLDNEYTDQLRVRNFQGNEVQENSTNNLEDECRQHEEENERHGDSDDELNLSKDFSDEDDVDIQDEMDENNSFYQDDVESQETLPDLFKNAKVKFAQNGNFNITICRAVINNTAPNEKLSSKKNDVHEQENLNKQANKTETRFKRDFVHGRSITLREKKNSQLKWASGFKDEKLFRITSEDTIFGYNHVSYFDSVHFWFMNNRNAEDLSEIFRDDRSFYGFDSTRSNRSSLSDDYSVNDNTSRRIGAPSEVSSYKLENSRCSSRVSYSSNISEKSECFRMPDNNYNNCMPITSKGQRNIPNRCIDQSNRCDNIPNTCVNEPKRCVNERNRYINVPNRCVNEQNRCVNEQNRCVNEQNRCVDEQNRCFNEQNRYVDKQTYSNGAFQENIDFESLRFGDRNQMVISHPTPLFDDLNVMIPDGIIPRKNGNRVMMADGIIPRNNGNRVMMADGIIPRNNGNQMMRSDGIKSRNNGSQLALSPEKCPSFSDITALYTDSQSDSREEFVSRWITEQDIPSNISRIKTLMENLCDNHFIGVCNNNTRCTKSHSITELERRINQLPQSYYVEVYEMVQNHYVRFICLFDVFTSCFEELRERGRELLVNMITDMYIVMKHVIIDKTPYVLKVIRALQKTGYSFRDAIEDIICKHGTSQIWICDILLFIISKESNLEANWPIVKRITFCRREKLDPQVVKNMMTSALNGSSANGRLGIEIFTEFHSKNFLTNIDLHELRGPLRKSMIAVGVDYRNYPELVDLQNEPPPRVNQNALPPFGVNGSEGRVTPTSPTSTKTWSNSDYVTYRPSSTENFGIDRGDVIPAVTMVTPYSNNCIAGFAAENSNSLRLQNRAENTFKKPTAFVPKRIRLQQPVDERPTCRYLDSRIGVLNRKRQNLKRPERTETPANPLAHPERQPTISKRYVCNISLHNLYPEVQISASEISSGDLVSLKRAVEECDIIEFLNILETYKESFAIEDFVLNTLTLVINSRVNSETFRRFIKLIQGIESLEPAILKDDPVKMLIEVVAMNLVYHFERKGEFEYCKNILRKVKDWHSLVTSKIFFCKSHLMTHMHRYIYLIQVLIRAKDYHWANEVFQTASLHLLEPMYKWPYNHVESDIRVRNQALTLFFEDSFTINFHAAKDLLKHIVVIHGGEVSGVDIWKQFEEKMAAMLDANEKYRSCLESLLDDVVHHYANFMSDNLLLSYHNFIKDKFENFIMDYVNDDVNDFSSYKNFYELYVICCSRNIFQNYEGTERVIKIKTYMTNIEICCVLESFFSKIINGIVNPHDVVIEIYSLQIDRPLNRMKSANRSIYVVAQEVIVILRRIYKIKIEQSLQSRIFITRRMLENILLG